MNRASQLIFPIALILLITTVNTSWAEPPPNPTDSDLYENTAGGRGTLTNNITGDFVGHSNTGFGSYALYSNIYGYENTAVGSGALTQNDNGYNNTAVGVGALQTNNTGYRSNTGNGAWALNSNVTGFYNTASGYFFAFNNNRGI
ncbi:MAG: hypothetical protein IPN42_16835 [Methylococcaceae bacterium]|nr:hypothetical protein [Methylococcaceae bacterium]